MPPEIKPQNTSIPMGDRSPKDNQKKTGQKQAKASAANNKKQQAVAAKAAAPKKK